MNGSGFLVRVAKINGSMVLAPTLFLLGGMVLLGCGVQGGSGSSEGEIRAFLPEFGPAIPDSIDNANHGHDFFIPAGAVNNPPAGGFNGTADSNFSHTHRISLRQMVLQMIRDNSLVTGTTSDFFGGGDTHEHNWRIQK